MESLYNMQEKELREFLSSATTQQLTELLNSLDIPYKRNTSSKGLLDHAVREIHMIGVFKRITKPNLHLVNNSDTDENCVSSLNNPREKSRIPVYMSLLQECWLQFPDLRFGQLLQVIAGKELTLNAMWDLEESEWTGLIKDFMDKNKSSYIGRNPH